ncbi:TetR/AcrR family transcriptional regulator [Streptomyces sp. SID13031]|uniref:TetR/AcrR family transcriptional regulator n=1 Tax=Streptomyces sp. SID13031 TaxID=2706046 RepID=UPI001940DCE2|nr:TetR/AcrR family transcriptional regulator [Streptomyces sp. SID13031]
MTTEEPGRRERKKLQTRQLISDAATTLFIERGFDHVTVAEVAKAADVAVQTVFNHFPAKEDLFFDEQGWWLGPAQTIREAPPSTGASGASGLADVLEALEQHYLNGIRLRLQSGHLATWKAFSRTIEESPALLARRRKNAEEMETLMVEALQERDPRLTGLPAQLIAAQYAAAQKVLEAELARVLPEHPDSSQVADAEKALEQAVAVAFGALKHGLQV